MTTQGTRRIVWLHGTDDFCLTPSGVQIALEQICDCGIFEIAERLRSVLRLAEAGELGGRAFARDVRETIRLGLVGGGKTPDEAEKIVKACVDGHPLMHNVIVAYRAIEAALMGVPDDPVGKDAAAGAETGQTSSTPMAASAAPQSSDSAPA